jgi:hypothetical protein
LINIGFLRAINEKYISPWINFLWF